jgi:hypothetical protein
VWRSSVSDYILCPKDGSVHRRERSVVERPPNTCRIFFVTVGKTSANKGVLYISNNSMNVSALIATYNSDRTVQYSTVYLRQTIQYRLLFQRLKVHFSVILRIFMIFLGLTKRIPGCTFFLTLTYLPFIIIFLSQLMLYTRILHEL